MEPIIIGIILMAIFIVMALVMGLGKLSPLLAIPIWSILWALIAGVPFDKVLIEVVEGGATAYASTTIMIIFATFISHILLKTGIAEDMIRRAAELGGARPFVTSALLVVVCTVLFTSLYGVGAVMMIGIIVLPIMMALGVPNMVATGAYLLGVTAGFSINLASWALYVPITGVKLENLWSFALLVLVLTLVCGILFLGIELKRSGIRLRWQAGGPSIKESGKKVPIYAFLAPIIPVILFVAFKWPTIPAFIAAGIYALITTQLGRSLKDTLDIIMKSIRDAFPDVAYLVAIWTVVGMLIKASGLKEVQAVLVPVFSPILPRDHISLIAFFALLAPLSLYRGPLQIIGTGAALAKIMLGTGLLPATMITAAWQGPTNMLRAADPTVSWVVWTTGYTKVEPIQYLRKILPYLWVLSAIIAILAGFIIR